MQVLRVVAVVIAFALGAPGTALAQQYPSKPVRLVVGFAPGGGSDVVARVYAQALEQALGQPFIVENKPGANGNIAAEAVAKAPPDGYTLLLAINTTVTNPLVYKTSSYDIWKDFVPVSLVANTPLVLACNPNTAATNLRELIALAKAKPGEVTYGTPGTASITQLQMELMNSMAGIRMSHVPYKGGAPALTAALAGEIHCSWFSIAIALPHIKTGKLRAFAVTVRNPTLPDVPTASEAGVPGYEADTWYGLLAPARTPSAIVDRLNAEINRIARSPEMKDRLNALGALPMYGTAAEFATFLRAEAAKWGEVITANKISVD